MATAIFTARVDAVFSRQFTAAIDAPASAGASVLTVVDGGDLDEVGVLLTPWDGATHGYTFDGEVTVTLGEPLLSDAELGETLAVWDSSTSAPVVDTVAHVVPLGAGVSDDVVEARVSFPLIPLLTEGIRSDEDAEAVTVRADGSDYVVAEVLGRAAALTDDFVTDVLVPQLPPLGGGDASDGLAPASNPAVALRAGIGAVFVTWLDVENADRLTYDVYVVPEADAARLASPPLESDLHSSVDGTSAVLRALPDGTVLSPDASYAVAVYARDADGQCLVDAVPVIGAPARVNSEDLALNALTAGHLTANDALFEALQAETITGVEIEGGRFRTDAGDRRIEIGPVSTEVGGGRIDFYSPDLDRPATVITSANGTLDITSGGDLDGEGQAQSARFGLTGVGPFSPQTVSTLEARSIGLSNSGAFSPSDGRIELDADDTLSLSSANVVDVSADAEVRISAPTIVLEGNVSQPSAAILDMQADGTNQSINDQTVSTLSNLTVVSNVGFDTYSGSQAIIPVSGLYLVSFTVTFPAGTSGRRVVDIRKGASSILVRGGEITTSVTTAIQASLPVYLNAGDDVRGTVYFTGPASLNFVGTYYLQHFTVAKIA